MREVIPIFSLFVILLWFTGPEQTQQQVETPPGQPVPVEQSPAVVYVYQEQPAAPSLRSQVIALALAEVGKPYIYGTEGPDAFDCSGLVQYVYGQLGIETTRTTFTQLEALRPVDVLQEGDMVYFEYSWDQHVGIVADLDQDGRWDMIHAAAPGIGVIVDYDVFSIPFFRDAVIGYRSALP